MFREAVEKKRLPLSDPEVMAAARPRIPRNSEYPIPPAKPFASANDIIMVDGRRYDTQVNTSLLNTSKIGSKYGAFNVREKYVRMREVSDQ